MKYAIGDIHGCYDDMILLLQKIEAKDPQAVFYFVGDFVDRGPKVLETVYWMMDHITEDGKYQSVCGNHEDMLLEWYSRFARWWYLGRAKQPDRFPGTYYDFADVILEHDMVDLQAVKPIIEFIRSLPVEKTILVEKESGNVEFKLAHAWYPRRSDLSEEQKREICIWDRDLQARGNPCDDYIIIHGHTPTISSYGRSGGAPGLICYRRNAVNIDGGCTFQWHYRGYPCMLCALCLDTFEEIYPFTLEERFHMLQSDLPEEQIRENLDEYKALYLKKPDPFRLDMLKRFGYLSN